MQKSLLILSTSLCTIIYFSIHKMVRECYLLQIFMIIDEIVIIHIFIKLLKIIFFYDQSITIQRLLHTNLFIAHFGDSVSSNTRFSLRDTTPVFIYKTLLLKSRELRKWIFVLKLFVITIVFTILSLRERVSLFFPYVIYCWLKKNMYNK